MSFTGTGVRLKPPRPEGEHSISELECIPIPDGYTKILYIVHPSTSEGMQSIVAHHDIQTVVDSTSTDSRVILIAPPSKYVYLEPATQVTDVRSDPAYHEWSKPADIPMRVTQITLTGGNFERCLGALFQTITHDLVMQIQYNDSDRRELTFNLLLDAIYSNKGITAAQALNYLHSKSDNFLHSVVALLSTPLPYYDSHGHGDFEMLSSHGRHTYQISLNNQNLGTLRPHENEAPRIRDTPDASLESEDDDRPLIKWSIVIPPMPSITIRLNITYEPKGFPEVSEDVAHELEAKLRHATEIVIPQYVIE